MQYSLCNQSTSYPLYYPVNKSINYCHQFFEEFNEIISQGSCAVKKFLHENIEVLRVYPDWINRPVNHLNFEGATLLYFAAGNNLWDLVREMRFICPTACFDVTPRGGSYQGMSLISIAAAANQWDLVREILPNSSTASLNAVACEGPNTGIPLIWIAAANNQWDVVREILPKSTTASLDASPMEGEINCGTTTFWLIVYHSQWDIAMEVLTLFPDVNLKAAPTNKITDALDLLSYEKVPKALKLFAELLNTKPSFLFDTSWQVHHRFNSLVVNATLPFFDLWHNHSQNLFMQLPTELKEKIAVEILYQEWPELLQLPLSAVTRKMMKIIERNNAVHR